MEIALGPVQYDRLVDALLDTSLMTYGRAGAHLPPGTSTAAVADAWREVCAEVPATRLAVAAQDRAATPRAYVSERHPEPATGPAAPNVPGDGLDLKGQLCRLHIVTDGTDGTDGGTALRLVLDYSHLALDERSAALLATRVARTAAGQEGPPLEPDPAAYQNWLRTHANPAADAAYWRTALSGIDAATPLFDETRRLPLPHARIRRELPPDTAVALHRTAAELGVPREWLLLLGWSVVVARFRGGEPSAVGVLLDSRPAALEDAIGVYETTLPLVIGLDRRPLADWLADQVAAVRRLTAHTHVPRAERNELSGRTRTVDLFDSTVDLRPASTAARGLPAPAVACTVRLDGDTLHADHDPDIAAPDLVGRLLDSLTVALDALTAGEGSTAGLRLLDAAGQSAVRRHNATDAPYPRESCLHQLFEAQVRRTPEAPALVYEGETLTYAELNKRANRLAHELIARGVRPDAIVGLCAEPGIALSVGILGILKAGAAYAPLDPFFPPDRLDYLYRDLDCDVVLVEEELRHLLPYDERRNVRLDPPGGFADRPDTDPGAAVTPANLAYVMYTSGSTGRPKGVLIEHGGAVNFVTWMAGRFDLRRDEAALQWTAYSFDAAVWEFFWPLITGARVVIAPGKIHLDLDRFMDLIADNQVATLHFVPAMLQTFLSGREVERCTSLRHVFVSGEPVPVSLMRRFHERLDGDLINLYGVTEVSIDSTYYVCPRGDELPFVRSGTPLSNTRTYVLDENLNPVPFGARGEVFIAGDSVTRGYLGRPGLTADRFVPDRAGGPGARMYRTGDIAQLLPDGHLRFLGRADHQVKIRGIRIELLEVAAEFNAHPAVRESLVVARGVGADRGLAAYVIAEEGARLDPAELRAFAADRMPPYMVPNAIVILDEFPLNANGKVDHGALPDPAAEFAGRDSGRAPAGPVEERIAGIWCRLLDLEAVGADEEFFAIGGNSLLATQVIGEVRQTFATELSLREWLEASTIAQLAQAIERRGDREREAIAVLSEVELDAG